MNRQTVSTFKPLAAALLAALGIVPLAAQAATIVVTSPGDTSVTGPTTCTLRQAIVSMNAGAISGTACTNSGGTFGSGDTINFDTGVFPGGSKITLASGELTITAANLTIDATANGNVTIDVNGSVGTFGNDAYHVIYDTINTFPAGSLTLSHLTLTKGVAHSPGGPNPPKFASSGGGICIPYGYLTLSNSNVTGNYAYSRGGGIFSGFGSITLINSTVNGNYLSKINFSGTYGGGISSAFGKTVTLTNSTVSGNVSVNGGGIYISSSHLTLTNSTVSGNSATGSIFSVGGGIMSKTSGHVTLTDSTVSGNSAAGNTNPGGGIYVHTLANLVVNNSIVAGNSPSNSDINGSLSSGTNNLIGGNPMLGALANNGGPTQTMMPQAGSPAINAVTCLAGIGTDQRGDPRPDWPSRNLATPCDIGAVEAGSSAAPTLAKSFSPKSIPLNGNSTLSFTVTNPNPVSASGVAFTDTLPSGVKLASTTVLGNCGSGTIMPTINSPPGTPSTVSLTGATLAANASCTFSVSVNGISAGAQVNTTGPVSSTEAGPGGTASDTLTVIAPPTIGKSFSPKSIPINGTSTLSFTVTNPNTLNALSGVAFTDTLPSGVKLASTLVTGSCGSGFITPTINSPPGTPSTVSLTGATLAANASCTFSVSVTGISAGAQVNTTSTVSSTEGGTGGTASDTLKVIAPPTLAKSFSPNSIPLNSNSTLSFTVTNPNTVSALGGVAFTDTLPGGMKLASTTVTGSCGSGTITPTINNPPGTPSTVSLTGGTLTASPTAGSSCTFSVSVSGITVGSQVNTTSTVSSTQGGTGGTATDTLTVLAVSNVTQSTPCMTTFVEGQSTMLDAAVTGFNPSGSVAFKNNATVLCSQALNSGHASCSTSSLTASTYSVIANYSGDANNTTATSQPLPLTVLSLADAVFRDAFEAGIVGCPVE